LVPAARHPAESTGTCRLGVIWLRQMWVKQTSCSKKVALNSPSWAPPPPPSHKNLVLLLAANPSNFLTALYPNTSSSIPNKSQ
jgi:hypothetical protein